MTIDLNQLIKEHGYEAEINPPESPQDGLLRRFKERWLFVTALLLILAITGSVLGWLETRQQKTRSGYSDCSAQSSRSPPVC